MDHKHIVMFSGGLGSWRAAKRVAAEHGTTNLVLLFADTWMEDPDLYRFLHEAAYDVGGELVVIAEGRTPWQVFTDVRFLGNSRVDPCSRVLKREVLRKWLTENTDPAHTTIYLGIGHDEAHRFENAAKNHAPWAVRAPLCEDQSIPLSINAARAELAAAGIALPRLYQLGFSHNNCGGFCVKAGQASFKKLLEQMPERYADHEASEEALRAHLGKDVSVMVDRRGGTKKPLTMRAFRERIQGGNALDLEEENDWGACACLSESS